MRRFVLRHHGFPILSLLFRLYYRVAFAAFAAACRLRFPCVRGVRLRRGLTRPGWVPGASDIDLLVEIRELAPAAEADFLRRFWRFYDRARTVFPMLGEVHLVDPRERKLVDRFGGVRDRADGGREVPTELLRLDYMREALQACLFLIEQPYFEARDAGDPAFGFKVAKGFLDALRYGDAALRPERLLDRRSYAASLEDSEAALSIRRPLTIDRDRAFDLCWRALDRLDRHCHELASSLGGGRGGFLDHPSRHAPIAWDEPLPNAELFQWKTRLKPLEHRAFPPIEGVVIDALLRWLVFTKVSDPAPLRRLFDHLDERRTIDPTFATPPLVVTRPMFQVLLWTHHFDTPFAFFGLSPRLGPLGLAARRRGRSPLLAGSQRVQWKVEADDFRAPPDLLLEYHARQTAANLALSLRLFARPGWSGDNAYRIALLYGRLLSLHLYLGKGIAADPDDLDRLVELYGASYPKVFERIEPVLREALETSFDEWNARPAEDCFYRHHPSYRLLLGEIYRLLPIPP